MSFVLIGFGWSNPVPINPSKFRSYKKHSVLVILSGIIANFIVAFIFSGLFYFLAPLLLGEYILNSSLICFFLSNLLEFCLMINLVLVVFNLLPIPPLDGFNLISMLTKYGNKFVEFMLKYGFLIFIFMLLPFFDGHSLLSLFYDYVLPLFIDYFYFFWGLF